MRRLATLERGDDRGVRFAEDVRHHVEAAAVGHAEHDLARAVSGGIVNDRVEHRHQGIGPLDREPLLPQVGLVEEALEGLDVGQSPQELRLLFRLQIGRVVAALDGGPQPGPFLGDLNLIEVVADAAAVDATQIVDRLFGVARIGRNGPGMASTGSAVN